MTFFSKFIRTQLIWKCTFFEYRVQKLEYAQYSHNMSLDQIRFLSAITLYYLTVCVPMDSSIWFYTIHLGWSIVYTEGSQVLISKKYCFFLSLKISFGLIANSVDHDEKLHNAAFNLGLHCLPKYQFWS